VLDSAWLEAVSVHRGRPFLFLAEGVFMYFEEVQVKSLVLTLHDRFPGAELVFDAFSPIMRWGHNVRVTRTGVSAYLHWGLKHARDLEQWSDPSTSLRAGGIRLLDERYPFQYPEPRMRRAVRMRLFPFLATAIGVFHYQL
jgi:O-methyltransferase involved in polyketide biosynthesis